MHFVKALLNRSIFCAAIAAQRIKGLAASFHADELIGLAQGAIDAAPGDPVALRGLDAFLADFDRVAVG